MASGITSRIKQHTSTIITSLFALVMMSIFLVLISKHYAIGGNETLRMARTVQNVIVINANRIGILDTCGDDGELTTFSSTTFICNDARKELVYEEIYNNHPLSARGRAHIYSFLGEGNRERADEMLNDVYYHPRFEPVTLDPITWTEDPFGERYWRFIFYSLRPVRHLLATAEETHQRQYYDKTREIVESFLDTGMDQTHSWDDPHGAAFRTMVLVSTWWRLREAGELTGDLSDKILAALEVHGEFLYDPENYEGGHNHAVTQAAALLVLARSFPELEDASTWFETAIERINTGLSDIIDEDGVLIENTPYYHFYVLEKYWEINRYANENDFRISDQFETKMDQMVFFATHVLQPNRNMPLLGATIPRVINNSGIFAEVAQEYPEFEYALTEGSSGTVPSEQYTYFPSSGIALFRSGWGEERPYTDETHVLFDTGPYRTDHSDLDVFTFSSYAAGSRIIRESGLYTYETDDPLYEYFHGTNGHNTIMVDGNSQIHGRGTAQDLEFGENYAYVSAWHELYPGVRHTRTLMLIENGALLIIDDLQSNTAHTYEQLFHLSENADITRENDSFVEGFIETESGEIPFSITQYTHVDSLRIWHGDTEETRGLCANAYESLIACHELSFQNEALSTRYITLVQMGQGVAYTETFNTADALLSIETPARTYDVRVNFPQSSEQFIELEVESEQSRSADSSLFEKIRTFFEQVF